MSGGRRRRGRRGGDADTRGLILDAARRRFAADGYDATSLRAIARDAGVDAALVHHYFAGKADVFRQSVDLPFDPVEVVPQNLAGPRDELGHRIARFAVSVWGGPGGEYLIAILRSAMTTDAAAVMLREFLAETLFEGIAAGLDVEQPRTRAALCASQVVGMGVLRHVVGVESLVSLSDDEVVGWIAPTLQRYLTGPLPGGAVSES